MKQQQGFTLIELIVVIVILGILAATAVPKFVDLQADARLATIKGIAGSMNSAKELVRARWLANGSTGATTVFLDGTTSVTVQTAGAAAGYPTADTAGISTAITLPSDAVDNGAGQIQMGSNAACIATYAASGTVTTATTAANCR